MILKFLPQQTTVCSYFEAELQKFPHLINVFYFPPFEEGIHIWLAPILQANYTGPTL